jgi:hypothetical protein
MRAFMPSVLILFSLVLLSPAFAAEDCRCQGCAAKAAPAGVAPTARASITPHLRMSAGRARTCFGKQSSWTDPKATTQPQ